MEFSISIFQNINNTNPKNITVSLEDLSRALLTPRLDYYVGEKSGVPLWSPTIFQGSRKKANAQEISCLVYDIDDGLTPYSTWRLFAQYWTVLAHTSFSSKPELNKYRVILPLSKPIPASDWDRASIAANQLWDKIVGIGEPDQKAIKDNARMYFRFVIPKGGDFPPDHPCNSENYHFTDYWHGDLLNLKYDHIKIVKPETRRRDFRDPKCMEDLELNRDFRLRVANQVGAEFHENMARKISCPSCRRNSVYYSIDLDYPNSVKWPQCNHRNSCGFWGTLKDLI